MAEPPDLEVYPKMYRMSFLSAEVPRNGPVEGCRGRASTRSALGVNFLHRHIRETMLILEDDNLPYPLCPPFYIMLPLTSLNGKNTTIAQCTKGSEQKRRRLMAEDLREITARTFQAYVISPKLVTSLKYLGNIMTASDDDWPELLRNLNNSRKSLDPLSTILRKEGENPRVLGKFFKAVVQAVIIMGSETWMMTLCMGQAIG